MSLRPRVIYRLERFVVINVGHSITFCVKTSEENTADWVAKAIDTVYKPKPCDCNRDYCVKYTMLMVKLSFVIFHGSESRKENRETWVHVE